MQHTANFDIARFPEVIAAERPRLVRLCAYLSGEPDAAEDIVQDVLLEAWRHAGQLRDPQALPAWLSGVARNVCARWLRARGRDSDKLARAAAALPPDSIAEPDVFELELERHEIAALLDQTLALLPPETREVLIQRYIAELSPAVIAERSGLSPNVVAVRLHRGRLALRDVLATDLRASAESFGLLPVDDGWRETRIWCSTCGTHRLQGSFTADEFVLRCPTCAVTPDMFHSQSVSTTLLAGVKGFRPAWMNDYFGPALEHAAVPCHRCGHPTPLRRCLPDYAPAALAATRGIHLRCAHCGAGAYETLDGVVLNTPAGRRFWQANPRIRTLPQREVEVDGQPALIIEFESLANRATLVGILDRDSHRLRAVREDRRG